MNNNCLVIFKINKNINIAFYLLRYFLGRLEVKDYCRYPVVYDHCDQERSQVVSSGYSD